MAGVSPKDIKNRIRSMKSTRQITRAMEMVAASKLRQAQAKVLASRPYFETLYATVQKIAENNRDFSSPYLKKREGNRTLYIVIAGDRGLAGGYNSNILKLCMQEMEGREVTVLPIGRKAVDYYRRRNGNILTQDYFEAAEVSVGDCFCVSRQICNAYLAGEYDEVVIGYTSYVCAVSQTAVTVPLLPLVRQEAAAGERSRMDTIYEPNSEEVFAAIVPEYLGGILYGAVCEARASEHAARRSAMDAATSNAEEMIAGLRLEYNRTRQAAITQEITEIVAGAES